MNTPFIQSVIVFTILWHGSRKQQSNTKGNESKGETNTRKVFEHFHACLIIPTHTRTKKRSPSGEAVVGCVCTNKKLPSRRPPTNQPTIHPLHSHRLNPSGLVRLVPWWTIVQKAKLIPSSTHTHSLQIQSGHGWCR